MREARQKKARYLSACHAPVPQLAARTVGRRSTPADTGFGRLPSRPRIGMHSGERRTRGRSGRPPPKPSRRQGIAVASTSRSATNWVARAKSQFVECNRPAHRPTRKADTCLPRTEPRLDTVQLDKHRKKGSHVLPANGRSAGGAEFASQNLCGFAAVHVPGLSRYLFHYPSVWLGRNEFSDDGHRSLGVFG
jgi:hypothetical protein